jgi:hypothetical protein
VLQSGEDVVVCVTADVEISRDLLDSEITFESTPTFALKCLTGEFDLPVLAGLPKQFIVLAIVDGAAILVQSVFLDRCDVGAVRKHCILDVQRYDLAGKAWHHDI